MGEVKEMKGFTQGSLEKEENVERENSKSGIAGAETRPKHNKNGSNGGKYDRWQKFVH